MSCYSRRRNRAVKRERAGEPITALVGRPYALPIAALGVEADKLVNKNQWTFEGFTKAAQTELDTLNAKKPQSPETVLPSNRTLKRSYAKLCPHEAHESDQQTLGRYIAACDLMGQASVVASLPVFYRGKPKDLIVNLDASTLKISEGRPPFLATGISVATEDLLAAGCWLLAVGCWLLAAGCSLLAACC